MVPCSASPLEVSRGLGYTGLARRGQGLGWWSSVELPIWCQSASVPQGGEIRAQDQKGPGLVRSECQVPRTGRREEAFFGRLNVPASLGEGLPSGDL